jgi:Uma2 family endonuclease
VKTEKGNDPNGAISMLKRIKTVSDYLAYDKSNPGTHEFIEGQCSSKKPIDFIANNFRNSLMQSGRSREFLVSIDRRLHIGSTDHYIYPELAIERYDANAITQSTREFSPSVVLEVVFDSTQQMDRVVKVSLYRSMDCVQQILLVSANCPDIQSLERSSDGVWILQQYRALDQVVALPSIGIRVPMAEIYCHAFLRKKVVTTMEAPRLQDRERSALLAILFGTLLSALLILLPSLVFTYQERDPIGRWLMLIFSVAATVATAVAIWFARQRLFLGILCGFALIFLLLNNSLAMILTRDPGGKYSFLFQGVRLASWTQMFVLIMQLAQLWSIPIASMEPKELIENESA